MKLFFDEDTGGGVPRALRAIGIDTESARSDGPIKKGTRDEDWIPFVAARGYLVFSCNTAILAAEAQRALLIEHRVGAVFLASGQERKLAVLRLILNRWDWLEQIDAHEERPFAYMLSISGRFRRANLP